MTPTEFTKQEERVNRYKELYNRRKTLENHKGYIDIGLIKIVAAYQKDISYSCDSELNDKLKTSMLKVYDDEILSLSKQMNDV